MIDLANKSAETSPSDTERLEWCLKHGAARTLGVVTDYEYVPLTLDLIDKAIARDRKKAAQEQGK